MTNSILTKTILFTFTLLLLSGCDLDLEDNKDDTETVTTPSKNDDNNGDGDDNNGEDGDNNKEDGICGPEHSTAIQTSTTNSSSYISAIKTAEYGDGSNLVFIEDGAITQSSLLASTETDYVLSSRSGYFYYLGRDSIDTFQKYYHSAPESGLYQTDNGLGYSTREAGRETSPNAHNIAFINDTIAIMPRRSDNKAWLVDLSAQTEADFKICELDLSAYQTQAEDGTIYPPHMFAANVTSNYVTITMQRLENYTPVESAYVAVFDTTTWEEVDTDPNNDGLKGIELNLKNPQGTSVNGDNLFISSLIYAKGPGDINTGGIEKINLNDFSLETVNTEYGYSSVTVTENGNIYGVNYSGWKNNSLLQITNNTSIDIGNASGKYLSSIASYKNELWLGYGLNNTEQPKIEVFNATNNSKIQTISPLTRSPVSIGFIEK